MKGVGREFPTGFEGAPWNLGLFSDGFWGVCRGFGASPLDFWASTLDFGAFPRFWGTLPEGKQPQILSLGFPPRENKKQENSTIPGFFFLIFNSNKR